MMAKSKVRKIKPPKDPLRLTHRTVRGNLGWAIPSAVGLAFAAWLAYRFAEFQRAAEVVAEPEDLKSNALIFNGIVIAVLVVTLLVSLPGLSSVWRSWRRGSPRPRSSPTARSSWPGRRPPSSECVVTVNPSLPSRTVGRMPNVTGVVAPYPGCAQRGLHRRVPNARLRDV